MVLTFRERSGREGPDDKRYDRFEAFYIALYERFGESRGDVRYFDVAKNPPRTGRPKGQDTIGGDELASRVRRLVDRRNKKSTDWADPA
jgi:hypothetical protein